ncbi:hypothetical protein DMC47_08595 [Nostoc sp. 3335mG]|nr:hypothetical protein DMC47_08595 [Nostoc sp. 3335mG]
MAAPALLIAACSAAPQQDARPDAAVATETDRTTLGGAPVTLVARDGACLVRREAQRDIALAPAAPCRFLRSGGQVQQHRYPDRGVDAVVLVIGSPASAAQKAEFGIAANEVCGTVAHGLTLRGTTVTAAARPLRGGMFCIDKGRDEKDFYAAALDN